MNTRMPRPHASPAVVLLVVLLVACSPGRRAEPSARATATVGQANPGAVAPVFQLVLSATPVPPTVSPPRSSSTQQPGFSAHVPVGSGSLATKGLIRPRFQQLPTRLTLRDFSVEAVFRNPYDGAAAHWDYGFQLRATAERAYRFYVAADRKWRFFESVRLAEVDLFDYVASGSLNNFDTAAGGSNHLKVIMEGPRATLSVNGEELATIDALRWVAAGGLALGTGFLAGNWREDAATPYEGLRVYVPAAPVISGPLPTRTREFGPASSVVTVDAQKDWQDTELVLREGDTVEIEQLAGLWRECPTCAYVGAEGSDRPEYDQGTYPDNVVFGCRHAALIADIRGSPFCVGSKLRFQVQQLGRLRLRINDKTDDNRGSIAVRVEVR